MVRDDDDCGGVPYGELFRAYLMAWRWRARGTGTLYDMGSRCSTLLQKDPIMVSGWVDCKVYVGVGNNTSHFCDFLLRFSQKLNTLLSTNTTYYLNPRRRSTKPSKSIGRSTNPGQAIGGKSFKTRCCHSYPSWSWPMPHCTSSPSIIIAIPSGLTQTP